MRAQVLEQSENKKEAGYMIAMGSNAMRVLAKMGIYLLSALAVGASYSYCNMGFWLTAE
jgi:hypothetical protein